MGDSMIKVENISKRYRLGALHGYRTFRDAISGVFRAPLSKPPAQEELWALRDVSFEVKRGEVLGIIGRNGAGKSTLLKILSRITEPTRGRVELRGRVGSLLEVGTGFHPELSGRENTYLYGAILGMSKAEVGRKFDEIVAFSELERFIDTPVKRYSSGMYMRLAFSVAAHLEPEILLVDEVLAVGDAIFQRKCIKKMSEAAGGGRTVLFVSHNLPAVSSFCGKALVFEGGRVAYEGDVGAAVDRYLNGAAGGALPDSALRDRPDRTGNGKARLTDFYLLNGNGERVLSLKNGEDAQFVFEYESAGGAAVGNLEFQFVILTNSGEPVFQFGTRFTGQKLAKAPPRGRISCRLKRFPLVPERYRLDAYLVAEAAAADYVQNVSAVDVIDGDFYGSGYQVFKKESGFLVDGDVHVEDKP